MFSELLGNDQLSKVDLICLLTLELFMQCFKGILCLFFLKLAGRVEDQGNWKERTIKINAALPYEI